MYHFKLNDKFLDDYRGRQPNFGPLGLVTYSRTYSRRKEDGGQEQFWETTKRVVEGCYGIQKEHCHLLGVEWDNAKGQRSAQEMFRRIWDFKFLPPGRGLWLMGTENLELKSAGLFNCAFRSTEHVTTDFAEPFAWVFEMLMLGTGVGFDSRGAGLITIRAPKRDEAVFEVPDSREGWVEALRAVMTPFTGKGAIPASFDFSKVRPAGSPINGFGGVASGPEPLKQLLQAVEAILLELVGRELSVTAINDIMNLIGKTVIAGNVRRSAEISLGNFNDDEFLNLKNPETNYQRLMNHGWAANNSVYAQLGMDYTKTTDMLQKNGEPGFVWLENCRAYGRFMDGVDNRDYRASGTNPCGEQVLEDAECCCLVEVFPVNHASYSDYEVTLKYAYLYAKTVTLLKTHSARTNAVMQRNRRIGCSNSGIVQAMQKFGRRNFLSMCDQGYQYLSRLDKVYSEWFCIPRSIRMTTVKPSGSTSLLPGVTPGIHFPHSEFYIRRIRFQENSPMLETLKKHGYPIERDVYSPNTMCVTFPVWEQNFARSKTDVTVWEQLELAAAMQHYWSDNSVSITATFKPEEGPDLKHALEFFESRLKTVSFLPLRDHKYEQAPYETISKVQYGELMAKIEPVTSFVEDTHEVTERFCTNDVCAL